MQNNGETLLRGDWKSGNRVTVGFSTRHTSLPLAHMSQEKVQELKENHHLHPATAQQVPVTEGRKTITKARPVLCKITEEQLNFQDR